MSISQNKLTPVLVVIAALIVVYVIYVKATARSAPVASGAAMTAVPQPGGNPASAPRSGGLFAGSKLPPARSADTDNNAETLNTVIASNREVRAQIQKVLEDNEALRRQAADVRNRDDAVAARVRAQLQDEAVANPRQAASVPATSTAAQNTAAPGNAVSGLIDNGLNAASQIINGIGGQPGTQAGAQSGGQNGAQPRAQAGAAQGNMSGLGYDGTNASSVTSNTATGAASMAAPVPGAALSRVIAPLGYRAIGGGERAATLERSSLTPARVPAPSPVPASGANLASPKPEAEPYFTIPENATLVRSTAMTTLVGRVPIDGRVQDPMQFKLVVGRDNLAASGQYVPDDISGVVISGIAVGDMALSCTEGLIQSMTFVFDDGTIRTVSLRTGGASTGFGNGSGGGSSGGGGVGGQSLAAANKLGWISDEYGNPCIPGKFVTNAPAYLTDVVGTKALSAVGAAVAAAQTTTTSGASALGSSTSSTVTGNQGSFVLGKVASAGSDEVANWLTKRMNNSFDAVVVRAGTRVAVHIDRAIHIDKEPDGRKLDYARSRTNLAQQQGARHGTD